MTAPTQLRFLFLLGRMEPLTVSRQCRLADFKMSSAYPLVFKATRRNRALYIGWSTSLHEHSVNARQVMVIPLPGTQTF